MVADGSRRPPSVERVLSDVRPRVGGGVAADTLTAIAREVIEDERRRLSGGRAPTAIEGLTEAVLERLDARADDWRSGLVSVINATGVIVHTNLGRAPWPASVAAAVADVAGTYLLLELDRETGRRGARFRAAEDALVALTGAEDALVTNNNAAALALAVGLAGRGGGVVVSRGELVEIGGGVRIPEIIRRAGAKLIEVGTTNRTRAADFEAPLAEGRARLVLRVHPSNFAQTGFTESPDARELAELAHRHGALLVDDLGSGALLDTAAYGLAHEPMPHERLTAGADVVTFSGDKLVGGPQAGLVVGRQEAVARMRRDPLARAMRPDKVTLAAVAATLGLYRSGRAAAEVPVWRMIAADADGLRARATALAETLPPEVEATVAPVTATVGGGSLPGETLPSWSVTIAGRSATALLAALRRGTPCVVARIEHERVVLDVRTVLAEQDEPLARAVAAVLTGGADRPR
jgi:L-seryl-tRNA(Ser) seleniumtransferase